MVSGNFRGHRHAGGFLNQHREERHYEVPTALIVAGIVVGVAAAGVGTYYAVQSSENQAALSRAATKQKKLEAQQAAESAAFEEAQTRRRTALIAGKQQAIMAAAGLDTTTGMPLVQDVDLSKQAEIEALNVRRTGRVNQQSRLFEAGIAKFRRDEAKGAIPFQIAGGVLSAAGSGLSGYSDYANYSKKRTVAGSWYE